MAMPDNGAIQVVVSTTAVVAGVWAVGHTMYSGYKAFKKDVYDRLNKTVTKEDCKDHRDDIDKDIREIRGNK
jgi:hypothetical protein